MSLCIFSLGRTNLDCDLLEEFLTEVGGGKRFTGHQESGKQNAFSCCVLAGMRSMQQRRVRKEMGEDRGSREGGVGTGESTLCEFFAVRAVRE